MRRSRFRLPDLLRLQALRRAVRCRDWDSARSFLPPLFAVRWLRSFGQVFGFLGEKIIQLVVVVVAVEM
jgi:hypothetical protein